MHGQVEVVGRVEAARGEPLGERGALVGRELGPVVRLGGEPRREPAVGVLAPRGGRQPAGTAVVTSDRLRTRRPATAARPTGPTPAPQAATTPSPAPSARWVCSRRAASHSSRTRPPFSGAYARYSARPNPMRPLFATNPGCPSVIAASTCWNDAPRRSVALGPPVRSYRSSFAVALASVDDTSSR